VVRIGLLHMVRQQVIGPRSHTWYIFEPYANVEDMDAPEILAVRTKIGCECNGNVRFVPRFATEVDILSGKIVPDWAGEYGSPAPARRVPG
jgi:hypothetical protein